MQNQEELHEIIEHNEELSSNFSVWPILLFILGLIIAALAYTHTLG